MRHAKSREGIKSASPPRNNKRQSESNNLQQRKIADTRQGDRKSDEKRETRREKIHPVRR